MAWFASGVTALTVLIIGLFLERRRAREMDREAESARVLIAKRDGAAKKKLDTSLH